MGYLDELKRQAAAARAQQTQDIDGLERNAMLTDAACQAAARYFSTLAQQLNVLQPLSKADWRLDKRTSFTQLRLTDFRADSRLKKLRDAEVFDHIVLGFDAKSGRHVILAKDFPPEIEKLESKLRQSGATYESQVIRDPENGHFVEKRYELTADFRGSVVFLPDHDHARIDCQIVNLDGLETVSVSFPAFEVGSARLDELARWIVGEPHAFLRDGQHLRRVAA
ncbi:MAG: hypothetical protein ABJA61_02955 [Caldimonas sp.]